MSKRDHWNTRRSNTLSTQTTPGYSSDIKFLPFLLQEYGSLEFMIAGSEALTALGKRFFKNNKRYQGALNFLRYAAPAAVISSEFISQVNKFRRIKSNKNSTFNEKEEKIRELFGIGPKEEFVLNGHDVNVGREILKWIMSDPKTEFFTIKGYYTYSELKPIEDIFSLENPHVLILIEYKKEKFVYDLVILDSYGESIIKDAYLATNYKNTPLIRDLKNDIFKEYISHFDISKNVLYFYASGLYSFERKKVKDNINQFDIDPFAEEIRKVLKRSKKRGYAFVGIPGTGKSTIIRKLEEMITEYPIIYVTPSNLSMKSEIKSTFDTIRHIQPCIVVLEDLDSFEFKNKNTSLGAFLDEIDDVNGRLNIVIISTINDTELVHYTILDRPGRIDQVYLIEPPKTEKAVYEILETRYKKNQMEDPFISFEKIERNFLVDIIKSKFTQADICEIIEKSLLMDDHIDNTNLRKGLDQLKSSKNAIRSANFSGGNPFNGRGRSSHTEAEVPQDATIQENKPVETHGEVEEVLRKIAAGR